MSKHGEAMWHLQRRIQGTACSFPARYVVRSTLTTLHTLCLAHRPDVHAGTPKTPHVCMRESDGALCLTQARRSKRTGCTGRAMGQMVVGWLSISRREPSVCSKRGGVPGATASTPKLTAARSTRYSGSVCRSAGPRGVRSQQPHAAQLARVTQQPQQLRRQCKVVRFAEAYPAPCPARQQS